MHFKRDVDYDTWTKQKRQCLDFLQDVGFLRHNEDEIAWALDYVRTSGLVGGSDKGRSMMLYFPIFSLLSHSCMRNCKFVAYPNATVALLAQKAIREGEEITISLVNSLEPTWKRRARLFRYVSVINLVSIGRLDTHISESD